MDWRESLKKDYGLENVQISAMEKLLDMLVAVRNRNLTAITDPEEIVRVHFLDSLWLLRLKELSESASVVDVGSGAGFPGLPLAIARPAIRFLLIEANHKKSEFISGVQRHLGLTNVTVLPVRAEEAGRSPLRESFDAALARAVGSLPEVLEYTLPLIKTGGHVLLQRGAREPEDESRARAAADELGGKLIRILDARPFPEARNLHVWVFQKTSITPSRFPRRPGMAKKRPLA